MSGPLDKLKALNELKHRGSTEAERQSAKEKLDQLCIRYNVSVEELDLQREGLQWYGFKVEDLMEFRILAQCIWFITERQVESITDPAGLRMAFHLSSEEVKGCTHGVNNFLKLWRDDSALVLNAFVMKHRLFGPDSQLPKVDRVYSQEESIELRKNSMRIMIIMEEMTASTWTKPEKNLKRLN